MCKLELTADQIALIYRGGNSQVKEQIKKSLGEKFTEVLPVTVRIQTLDDAIAELGDEHPAVSNYKSAKYLCLSLENDTDLMAYLKLRIIVAALNEGWEPKFTECERRWYPWFEFLTNEEMEEMSDDEKEECRVVGRSSHYAVAYGGLVYSYADNASSNSYTDYGSRLALKTEILAEYAGKQFIEIYADYCFIPTQKEK